MANSQHIGLFQFCTGALFTKRHVIATTFYSIIGVVFTRSRSEMARIHTGRIIARVKAHWFRPISICQIKTKDVSRYVVAIHSQLAVPVFVWCARPKPTSVRLSDLRPKASFRRFGSCSKHIKRIAILAPTLVMHIAKLSTCPRTFTPTNGTGFHALIIQEYRTYE